MSIEKKVLAVLTAATVAVTAGALAVNAVSLGETGEGVKSFTINGDESAIVTVLLDSEKYGRTTLTADFSDCMLPDGNYTFSAKSIVIDDFLEDFYATYGQDIGEIVQYEAVEIKLFDADGNEIHEVKPFITFETEKAYFNSMFVYDDKELYILPYEFISDHKLGITLPHLSRFVFAYLEEYIPATPEEPSPSSSEVDPSYASEIIEESSEPRSVDPEISLPESKDTEKSDTSANVSQVKPGEKEGVKTGDNSGATAFVLIIMGLAALGTSLIAIKAKKSSK